MRLIDADGMLAFFKAWQSECTGNQSMSLREYNWCEMCIRGIENEPTAYDIDKVVEQLREEKQCTATHGDDQAFRSGRISGLLTAMRIVKAGGKE